MAYIYADKTKPVPDWIPGVKVIRGNDSGPMLPGSKWSLLLHTTEGGSTQGAIAALRAHNAWSHFIYNPATDELIQCVPLNRASRSLRSGGNFGKTNAARVIQVEIVGFAHESPFWTPTINARVGRMIRTIANHVPFDVSMPVTFYGDRSGFTVASETAKQRMSWFNWYRFDAICGHQHAPRNSHWDPGEIQVNQILAAARQGSDTRPQPKPPWVPPKFPGYTLREGQKSQDVAVLKMLLIAGGYGKDLDVSTPDKAKTFGNGTRKAVVLAMADYYALKHEAKISTGAVGSTTWKFLCGVVANIKKHEK